jgi:hypothetical protein
VYLPELSLFQQINFTIEANPTFWTLFEIGKDIFMYERVCSFVADFDNAGNVYYDNVQQATS